MVGGRRLFIVAFIVISLLPGMVSAQRRAEAARVEPDLLRRLEAEGAANFFVKMALEADLSAAHKIADWDARGRYVYDALRQVATAPQSPVIEYAQRHRLDYTSFIASNSVFVRGGTLAAALDLARLPGVAYLRLERLLAIPDEPASAEIAGATAGQPAATMDWGIVDTKADQVWSQFGAKGEGITVASIDTGVDYTHIALQPNYKCGAGPHTNCWLDPGTPNCQGPGGGPCEASPTGGYHGTHTLATAVAADDPTFPYIVGMAPHAQWIACLGCPYGPVGCPEFDTSACADWLLAPGGDPANRPHVVSNSWGSRGGDTFYESSVNAWLAAGIFPAFAAGNTGPNCTSLVSPGDYQTTFSTAAHDSLRSIGSFSSRGPSYFGHEPYTKPNISAPGVAILSAKPGNRWEARTGTSTASPHSAGAVALVWSACPNYLGKAGLTMALLENTADPPPAGTCDAPPDAEGNYTFGYGYLNVLTAVGQCREAPAFGTLAGQVIDGAGTPVVDARIVAKPAAGGAGIQATTDSSGNYTMQLLPGTYNVNASKPGYVSASAPGIVVASGGTTVQDFTLNQWGSLEGHVYDQEGYPLEGVAVAAQGENLGSGTDATTDPSGYYTMQLFVGTYTVTALKDGYAPATIPGVVVAAGQVTVQDFTLNQHVVPDAAFSGEPTAGPAPLVVQFSDESTGTITSWLWDFGDGQTGTAPDPVHGYAQAGTYTVSLTVSGPAGTDTLTRSNYISVYSPVHAWFSGGPTSGFRPLTVTFVNHSIGDFDTCTWSSGDGETADTCNGLTHTYTDAGLYTVSLTVSGRGGTDVHTRTDYISVAVGKAHVSDIGLTYQLQPPRYLVSAAVGIVNQNNQRLAGATVSATWTLPNGAQSSQQALSNTSGIARFSVKSPKTGIYQICITNISRPGWEYDPGQNVETCDTIAVP